MILHSDPAMLLAVLPLEIAQRRRVFAWLILQMASTSGSQSMHSELLRHSTSRRRGRLEGFFLAESRQRLIAILLSTFFAITMHTLAAQEPVALVPTKLPSIRLSLPRTSIPMPLLNPLMTSPRIVLWFALSTNPGPVGPVIWIFSTAFVP